MKNLPIAAMVAKYQCPGCTLGGSDMMDECGEYEPSYGTGGRCANHSAGTIVDGVGRIMLGFPRGFNRPGPDEQLGRRHNPVRLYPKNEDGRVFDPKYDKFNHPVWAMEYEGDLLVRVYSPSIGVGFIDVIEGGKRETICPDVTDVGEFYDEID